MDSQAIASSGSTSRFTLCSAFALTTRKSYEACRFAQNSGVVLKKRAKRNAISLEIGRFWRTI